MKLVNFRVKIPTLLLILCLISSSCQVKETDSATPSIDSSTAPPTVTPLPEPTRSPEDEEINHLRQLISPGQILDYITYLTGIQPYSGWRTSGSLGELEAQEWAAEVLGDFSFLQGLGLEIDFQRFHVFLATEIWDSRLFLTTEGKESEVPVNAITGHREILEEALRFDSDGTVNDSENNPVEVTGDVLVLQSMTEYQELADEDLKGRILFIDFRIVDPGPTGKESGLIMISNLLERGISGVILVTESPGGKYAPDGTTLEGLTGNGGIPMMILRLEDLAQLGINSWEELEEVESVRVIWDVDVFSPGESGNLVARIPGVDPSRAMILGAHIDSANTPGASDNAMNAAILLELARVLDAGEVQPPVDLYLVWFGSEELGFYGSQHFVVTHSELLDRSLGAFNMDGFTANEPGPTIYGIVELSYIRFGDETTPFVDYLAHKAEQFGIPIEIAGHSPVFNSDEGPFQGFIPAVRFAFGSSQIGRSFHSPYDDLEILQDQERTMEESAAMTLIASLGTPRDAPEMSVVSPPDKKALILSSHTDPLHMSPSMLINLNRTLAWQGFDVDVVPYGQSPDADELAEADLVIVLPVVDYPGRESGYELYDEIWSPEEIALLVDYVERGGFLVLTNSFNRLLFGKIADPNEDWKKVNDLSMPFGIGYAPKSFSISSIPFTGSHDLAPDQTRLEVIPKNGVAVEVEEGSILAAWQDQAALVLVEFGDEGGEVLALSDLGSLDLYDFRDDNDLNQDFLMNLALYARDR